MKQKIDLAQASEGLALYAAQRLAGLPATVRWAAIPSPGHS